MRKSFLLIVFFLSTVYVSSQDSSSNQQWYFDSTAKHMELNYKIPKGYQAYDRLYLASVGAPEELMQCVSNSAEFIWEHEDKECILFIKASGGPMQLIKTRTDIPLTTYNRIRAYLKIGNPWIDTTDEQIVELNKILTYWSAKKAKKVFNAQHVICYPYNEEKAIYQDRYLLRQSLCIVKWETSVTVAFLLTDKGYKNINKYMKDIEKAFWFND